MEGGEVLGGQVCRKHPPPPPTSLVAARNLRSLNINMIVVSLHTHLLLNTEYLHSQDDEEAEDDPAHLQDAREVLESLPGEDPEEEAVEESSPGQSLHHRHRSVVEAGPSLGEDDPEARPW